MEETAMPPEEKTTTEEGDSKQTGLPVLRTFKSDSASFIKKEGVSMVDVASAEAKKGFGSFISSASGTSASFFSARNIIIASIVLILVGATIGSFAIFGKKEVVVPAATLPKPFLTSNFEKETTLDGLPSVIKEPVKEDKLLYIAVVEKDTAESGTAKRLANTGEFFRNFNVAFPGETADIFEGSFMLGVYNYPFIAFKIKSYEKAFISMMKWEEKIADDLEDIFMAGGLITAGPFVDKEIRNHDARVLSDSSGAPIISYSFINKDYLVISSSPDTLDEIIKRFSLSQYLNQ